MTCKRSSVYGFTLLEMVVALAVASLLMLAAQKLLRQTVTTWQAVNAREAALDALERDMNAVVQDFSAATNRAMREKSEQRYPFAAGAQAVIFTRLGWRDSANRSASGLRQIYYQMDPSGLFCSDRLAVDNADEPYGAPTLRFKNAEQLSLAYLDENNRWQSTWPPQRGTEEHKAPPVPRAVKINLLLKPFGVIERIIPVSAP